VEAEQVHGNEVAIVTPATWAVPGGAVQLAGVDALLTDRPGVLLTLYVADCLAIYLWHRGRPAVGLAHAGWRGLAAKVAGKFAQAALEAYGGGPEDLEVILSPCIGPCCFEVGEQVAKAFDEAPGAVDRARERPHVDLRRVALVQLEALGVRPERVTVCQQCTRCEADRFASYRAQGEDCGRNLALVGLTGNRR